jgi:uncharacterized membrane protein (UPF0136 family)
MSNKNYSYSLFLTLVSLWWGWTVLVDFFMLPAVFKTVNDFFNAGELGMTLFSQLNALELIVSSLLIVVTALKLKQSKKILPFFILTLAAFSIVIFYLAFLTPKIVALTDLWREAEKLGASGIGNIPDIQQEHQFFHKLYIRIDTVKLIILTILLGTGLFKQDKWS